MEHLNDAFITLKKEGESLFKDRGSKFYGYAFHAKTEEEVKNKLDALRAEHKQARHVCYAYILDTDGYVVRANDDGEPSHSAGTPILNQIKSEELVQILVAVVRYFGGTKLGVSGLINAYKIAAEEAIEQATKQTLYKTEDITVRAPFEAMNDVMRLTNNEGVTLVEQHYEEDVTITLNVRLSSMPMLLNELKELHRVTIESKPVE